MNSGLTFLHSRPEEFTPNGEVYEVRKVLDDEDLDEEQAEEQDVFGHEGLEEEHPDEDLKEEQDGMGHEGLDEEGREQESEAHADTCPAKQEKGWAETSMLSMWLYRAPG